MVNASSRFGDTYNKRLFWSSAAHTFEVNYERTHVIQFGFFKGKTPYEATWNKPYVGEVYNFGCSCSFLTRPEERDKFGSRSTPGVFLTYGTEGAVEVLDHLWHAGLRNRQSPTESFGRYSYGWWIKALFIMLLEP